MDTGRRISPHPTKQEKWEGTEIRELFEKCLLGVLVCLPPPSAAGGAPVNAAASKAIPIGMIVLMLEDPKVVHHRRTMLGINIITGYQRQGYGSEAIRWALKWGFVYANLHRIELGAYEWNSRAIRLYERLGFVPEGRRREHIWFRGRYWDLIEMGVLEHEWRARYGEEDQPEVGVPNS